MVGRFSRRVMAPNPPPGPIDRDWCHKGLRLVSRSVQAEAAATAAAKATTAGSGVAAMFRRSLASPGAKQAHRKAVATADEVIQ
jgi:hypothetical protein